jgi:hypothetical protein
MEPGGGPAVGVNCGVGASGLGCATWPPRPAGGGGARDALAAMLVPGAGAEGMNIAGGGMEGTWGAAGPEGMNMPALGRGCCCGGACCCCW